MKIGFGGFGIESTTFSPLRTMANDFRIMRGEEILPFHEAIAEISTEEGVELLPAMRAHGMPNALVKKEEYLKLRDEIVESFRKLKPLDGILLTLHGAMEVEEIGSGEEDFLRCLRKEFGKEFPIGCSLDLHGNISKDFSELITVVSAYRTAPHRDLVQTICRAYKALCYVIKQKIKPETIIVKIPLILPGERVITEAEPAKTLYSKIEELDKIEGLLGASALVGFAWADTERTGSSIIVTAKEDRSLAIRHAKELAELYWSLRRDFGYDAEALSVVEAIKEANLDSRTVFVSDSGDNITAGAPGDLPLVLEEVLKQGCKNTIIAPIYDPVSVDECFNVPEGGDLILEIGCVTGEVFGKPVSREVSIKKSLKVAQGRLVLLDVSGVEVVISDHRMPFYTPDQFKELGIDPLEKDIVVVKLGYLMPELEDIAPRSILALSAGVSAQEIETLPFKKIKRPAYPFEEDTGWVFSEK